MTAFAPVTDQLNATFWPAAAIVVGFAENVLITGAPFDEPLTVTVAVMLALPELFDAVNVYVVVVEGEIVTDPARLTGPMP